MLGISLLRGPLYPDPLADEGEHRFTYSLFPHPGDWTEAGVAAEAFALNSPLVAASVEGEAGSFRLVESGGVELALGGLKMAEDGRGVVLRVYEAHGARGRATLRFALPVAEVGRADLLEEPADGEISVEGDTVALEVRSFEVVTLRVGFGPG